MNEFTIHDGYVCSNSRCLTQKISSTEIKPSAEFKMENVLKVLKAPDVFTGDDSFMKRVGRHGGVEL